MAPTAVPHPNAQDDLDVLVEIPNKTRLEAQLHRDPGARFPDAGLLLIHPYTLLGGSMHDVIIAEIFRQAVAARQFGVVARYNQRGVGASSGSRMSLQNLRGQQDGADALDMTEFVALQLEGNNRQRRVVVMGYSFGACVATYCLNAPHVAAYVGISFPMGGLSSLLKTHQLFDQVCGAVHLPRLLVLGTQDQYTKEARLVEAVKSGGGLRLRDDSSFEVEIDGGEGERQGNTQAKAPLLLKVLGDDHFWSSEGAAMVEFTLSWCEHILSK